MAGVGEYNHEKVHIRGRNASPLALQSASFFKDEQLKVERPARRTSMIVRVSSLLLFTAVGMFVCISFTGYSKQGVSHSGGGGGGGGEEGYQPLSSLVKPGIQPLWLRTGSLYGRCPKPKPKFDAEGRKIIRHYPQPVAYSRAECECTPVHNFVILSMQRSGSGWFETLLNDHPNISSNGEVFRKWWLRSNFSSISNTLDQVYNLDWKTSAAKNECTVAVGLKWMLNQGAMEYHKEVSRYFEEKDVSIILLLRRNVLKRLISILANAHDRKTSDAHKSHTHSEEEAEKLRAFKPTLHVGHLKSNLQRVQLIAQDALAVFNRSRLLQVYYEDVVNDQERMGNAVLEFLGAPERRLESKQVKIHTKPLSEQIANWDEVYNLLKGTEYETFLDD